MTKPTKRIIHIRDWHFVSKDLFAADLRDQQELTDEELERHYSRHLQAVESVQDEQVLVLLVLIKRHGLKRIFAEGVTSASFDEYKKSIDVLKEIETHQLPQFQKQLEQLKSLPKRRENDELQTKISNILNDYKKELLRYGAAGRLWVSGEIREVAALDDAATLRATRPIDAKGQFVIDRNKIEARHDSQVRIATTNADVAVIVLGGAHDLTPSVKRVHGCEYIRVTTKRFQEVGDD